MIKSWQDPMVMNGGKLAYQDRVAIVTGAASGIGLATGRKLLSRGYQVVAVDVRRPKEKAFQFIEKDLSKGSFVFSGSVELLVCSHGIGGPQWSWEVMMGVNATGVRNVVEGVLPKMGVGGSIVFVASMTGPVLGNKGMQIANYAASKGAVVGYMRQLAVELAPKGIRINAICPGPVVTPMTDNLKKRDPELYEEFFGRCLLPGKTTAEDIAEAILHIVEMPRMTGQMIVVDGGYSIW